MSKESIFVFFTWVQYFFLVYFAFINLFYTFLIVLGSIKIYFRRKDLEEDRLSLIFQSNSLPEIAFLIPMYNESYSILENIKNILHLSYRYKKIVIVDDGSSDSSVDILVRAFDMIGIPRLYEEELPSKKVKTIYQSKIYPEVLLLKKEHGGKFDAVNAGVNAIDSPFMIVVDADTFIDDVGFTALIRPLLMDAKTIGVGASVRVKNSCTLDYNSISSIKFPRTYLMSMQGIEYFRSFLARVGWNFFNGNFIIAGAFSVFPRDLIAKAGGFCDSVGEDVEITVRLHRMMKETHTQYKIFYVPDPIAWTIVPEEWNVLANQRSRWHLAVLETLYYHKRVFLNPRYGVLGLFVYPFWLFAEALEPIIEVFGYFYILFCLYRNALHMPFLVFYIALSFGLIFLYTVYCVLIEYLGFQKYPSMRAFFLMFTSCLVENLGYHQLNIYWRIKAFYHFIKKFPKIRKESKKIRAKIAKAKNF